MGAPDFAVPALDALVDLGVDVVAVYTKAPKPGVDFFPQTVNYQ